MGRIDDRIAELGLVLPQPMKLPPGMVLPFPEVNMRGRRALISGAGPLEADGTLAGPFGKVGSDLTVDEAAELARKVGLVMIASLKRALGDLDRVACWVRIFGMVNSAPGFDRQPLVINGCTGVILDVFGQDVGQHARSAVGMAELPMNIAVEIEGEVELTG